VRADEKLVSSIKESYLWFSDPRNLNDPFDCQRLIDADNTAAKIFQYLSEYGGRDRWNRRQRKQMVTNFAQDKKSHFEDINGAYQDSLKNVGICCFSEINDNSLMWAHYADSHKGACLVFDFQMLASERIGVPIEIKYEKILPKYNYVRVRINGKRSPLFNYRFDQIVLGTKTREWQYEREIRLVSRKQGKNRFSPKALAGIIFGAKINQKAKENLLSCARKMHEKIKYCDEVIDLERNRIVVDHFENYVCEGEVLQFIDQAGTGLPSYSIMKYRSDDMSEK
jgi:hypothetical protein